MQVAIVNDCSGYLHFGCDTVMKVYADEFKKRDVKIRGTIPTGRHWVQYSDLLRAVDLVVVNGEGSIHHGNFPELINIAESYPCVLVNSVFEDVPLNKNLKAFKYISVRESFSKTDMEGHGVSPEIVPDLIFAHDFQRPEVTGDRIVIDSIKASYGISPHRPNALELIGKSKEMVTGRFHGACLALMWGMDFSAYPSNTHKTIGMLTDAGCPHLYFETQEEAEQNVQPFDGSEYVKKARQRISEMFDKICFLTR